MPTLLTQRYQRLKETDVETEDSRENMQCQGYTLHSFLLPTTLLLLAVSIAFNGLLVGRQSSAQPGNFCKSDFGTYVTLL
jgi:hypothetical protein